MERLSVILTGHANARHAALKKFSAQRNAAMHSIHPRDQIQAFQSGFLRAAIRCCKRYASYRQDRKIRFPSGLEFAHSALTSSIGS